MNYIVFDIEFNQPMSFNKRKFKPNRIAPFEIIEIGAVKLDKCLNILDKFEILIKPQIYKRLSPIVTRKTKIYAKDLENGYGFCKSLKLFKEWIGNDNYILCTWSKNDIIEMKKNCKFHDLECLNFKNHIDIQKLYMYKYKLPKGQLMGLKTAILQQDISVDSKLHRALNDALYTVYVFQKIFDEKLLYEYENK